MTGPSAEVRASVAARLRVTHADALALAVWLASRSLALVVSLVAARARGDGSRFLVLWDRWDVGLFTKIARFGYFQTGRAYPDCCTEAFFPGQPLAVRAAHAFVGNWVAAGMLVALVGGAVASVALSRLAIDMTGDPRSGPRAVALLVLSPYAVFLAAGYSEALFLGCAVLAWLAARRGLWAWAGLCAGAAAGVRVTGLFLAVGLAVEWVVSRRRAGQSPVAPAAGWLLVPWGVLAGYAVYLRRHTGDWLAWSHAEARGWDRRFAWPWDALHHTISAATAPGQTWEFSLSWWADVVATVVGIVLTVVLCRRREWGLAAFTGLAVIALATSTYYLSVARSLLLAFPLWVVLAGATLRHRALLPAYVVVCAPLSCWLVVLFTSGRWVN